MDKSVHDMFEVLRDAVVEAWESIEKVINHSNEVIEEIEREKHYRKSWRVPKNSAKNHQVINRKPMVSYIRNQI